MEKLWNTLSPLDSKTHRSTAMMGLNSPVVCSCSPPRPFSLKVDDVMFSRASRLNPMYAGGSVTTSAMKPYVEKSGATVADK